MKKIINRQEIVDQLARLLKKYDIERNPYQIDVHLHVNDSNIGTLAEYIKSGKKTSYIDPRANNSTIELFKKNDNHDVIYSCYERPAPDKDTIALLEYDSYDILREIIEMTLEEFSKKINIDPDVIINEEEWRITEYLYDNDELMDKLEKKYEHKLDEWYDYPKMAENIITAWEKGKAQED